jgi:anti-anti-sigma regulatory factor
MVVCMTMTTIPLWLDIDGEHVGDALQQTCEKLNGGGGDVFLNFSSVTRIDPGALKAMEELAGLADDKNVKVALRGVSVQIYKVLKLVKLAPRLTFVA